MYVKKVYLKLRKRDNKFNFWKIAVTFFYFNLLPLVYSSFNRKRELSLCIKTAWSILL